jgi:hypothetical protein
MEQCTQALKAGKQYNRYSPIGYLDGGNIYALQALLGHSSSRAQIS